MKFLEDGDKIRKRKQLGRNVFKLLHDTFKKIEMLQSRDGMADPASTLPYRIGLELRKTEDLNTNPGARKLFQLQHYSSALYLGWEKTSYNRKEVEGMEGDDPIVPRRGKT